jgi:transposase
MEIPVAAPKALLADKGYDGDRFWESLLIRGILPIIPPRSNRKVPEHPDYRRYRDRNRVERMFGKLKQQRRIATRYYKSVLAFESFRKPRCSSPREEVFCQHSRSRESES